jgi:hypothetical protein
MGGASLIRGTHQSINVIASEAKQSSFIAAKLDCFVASAPRNDDKHTSAFPRRELALSVIIDLS